MISLHLALSFLERPANARPTGPWLLVLLHGVGSNEQDLDDLPLTLRYADFPGGYEIRPAELQAAMQWLEVIRG